MVKKIFKYPLADTDIQKLYLPKGAEILTLQVQYGKPHIWALIDPDAEIETRAFLTYGTGHSVPTEPYPHTYIGTYQQDNGMFVAHVFEIKVPE